MYKRIITHNDFDGVVSATICSSALGVNFIVFTGPRTVAEARISITTDDIVCDLPYPLECGLWFDHHEGNLEELQYRNIDPESVGGRFAQLDSCARVVFEYFEDKKLPDHFEHMVVETDIIDAFKYENIEDWRRETPGKIIDSAIKLRGENKDVKWQFMRNLVAQLKNKDLENVATTPAVQKRYRAFVQEEEQMLEQIRKDIVFLPNDHERQIVIIDLTRHSRRPNIIKHLAYLIHPESLAVIEIKNLYQKEIKTNDLALSMSLSVNLNNVEHQKDVGDIMRQLNIGSGHAGAGAGTISCKSKDEMIKSKDRILNQIYKIFSNQ